MAKKEYLSKVKKIEEVAKGTFALTVEKPKGFTFKAGQYTELHLKNIKIQDPKGNYRELSISSAPHEKDILFVFRKGESMFKNEVVKLKPGDEVAITDAVGEFTLPEKLERDIIFLVGGIGMTAIRTILMHALHKKLPLKSKTFYSNRTPEDVAFFEELKKLPKDHEVIFTMTGGNVVSKEWKGEASRIDAKLLKKYDPKFREKQFYIVGPAGFVTAMVALTRAEKIPFSQVKLESFGTYQRGV
jgi:ferredoxin-NADP reductase